MFFCSCCFPNSLWLGGIVRPVEGNVQPLVDPLQVGDHVGGDAVVALKRRTRKSSAPFFFGWVGRCSRSYQFPAQRGSTAAESNEHRPRAAVLGRLAGKGVVKVTLFCFYKCMSALRKILKLVQFFLC